MAEVVAFLEATRPSLTLKIRQGFLNSHIWYVILLNLRVVVVSGLLRVQGNREPVTLSKPCSMLTISSILVGRFSSVKALKPFLRRSHRWISPDYHEKLYILSSISMARVRFPGGEF